jgi:hypothetical protein
MAARVVHLENMRDLPSTRAAAKTGPLTVMTVMMIMTIMTIPERQGQWRATARRSWCTVLQGTGDP